MIFDGLQVEGLIICMTWTGAVLLHAPACSKEELAPLRSKFEHSSLLITARSVQIPCFECAGKMAIFAVFADG